MSAPRQCRSCGAAIFWAIAQKSGKAIPVDIEPSANGTLAIVGDVARQYTSDDGLLYRARYSSHFATCPDADDWRRP